MKCSWTNLSAVACFFLSSLFASQAIVAHEIIDLSLFKDVADSHSRERNDRPDKTQSWPGYPKQGDRQTEK